MYTQSGMRGQGWSAGLQVFFCIAFSAFGVASAQQAFPDITKASGAVKRVFAVIDRVPSILPNTSTGMLRGVKCL